MKSDKNKVIAKYHRLRLTDDIRNLIRGLPVSVEETQVGSHVYLADGEVQMGLQKSPVRIRIECRHGKLSLVVKSGTWLAMSLPYDTPEQRARAPAEVRAGMLSLLS